MVAAAGRERWGLISLVEFNTILDALRALPAEKWLNGIAIDGHIAWSENAGDPKTPDDFALEAIFVICNSGMKHTVARRIFDRISEQADGSEINAGKVFGHRGKAAAIDEIWRRRAELFHAYLRAADKVEFCGSLPWIGKITKFHLAKNFGADVAKPDVHLDRLAYHHNTTPQALCNHLAKTTGYKVRTVDLILWMACAKGIIKSTELDGAIP